MATVARGADSGGDQQSQAAADLRATLGARRELGPEYDQVLADSFLERVDALVAARVAEEAARHSAGPRTYPPGVSVHGATAVPRPHRYPIGLAYLSLLCGVPITAIAGGTTENVAGVAVAWAGIGVVNLAAAWGHRKDGDGHPHSR